MIKVLAFALTFTAAGHIVVHNSSALGTVSSFTILAWIYATDDTTRQQIIRHTGTPDWGIQFRGDQPGDYFYLDRHRATTYQVAQANSGNFSNYGLNKWIFVVGVIDLSGVPRFYIGDLNNYAAEPSSYTTQTAGSGTPDTTNANVDVGNFSAVNTRYWRGRIAWVGVWDRALSAAEIRAQQFRPRVTPGCVFFAHYYEGRAVDLSGNKANGSITGATGVPHAPFLR